jgi:exopolysaccharide biosynthesis protein
MKHVVAIIALCCIAFAGCQKCDDGLTHTRKKIASGITYEQLQRPKRPGQEPLNVHVLTVDPSKASMEIVLAKDTVLGKETTTSMASRTNASAAINGGFFIMKGAYRGDLDGFFAQNGIILSDPAEKRSSFGFCATPKGQEPVFEQFELKSFVPSENGEIIRIDGINREPKQGETILLTEKMGDTARIEQDMSVIVGNGTSGEDIKFDLRSLRSGKSFPIERCSFTSAGPTLILGGKIVEDYTSESPKFVGDFVDKPHPRTAVGQEKDGTLLFVVVDGRQPNLSVGMTLPELAKFMKELGAVDAYNLDGGGSSTMVVENRIVNSPSDRSGERPLSDAIVIISN